MTPGRPLALLLVLAFGCSDASTPPLEGTWTEQDGSPNQLSFGPGGAFRQLAHGLTYEGTWRRLDPDRAEVRFTGESSRLGTIQLRLAFKDGVLTTENPGGRVQRWVRR